jgi:DNA-binding protein H-NS
MKTIEQIRDEIAELKTKITALETEERQIIKAQKQAVLKELQAKMAQFGITADDFSSASKASGQGKERKPTKAAPIKYKGPNGEAWSGRGLMPKWLKAAKDEGRDIQEFAV